MIARISTLTAVVLSAGLVLSAASPAVAKDRHKHRGGVFNYGAITSGGDGKHRNGRRIIIYTGKFGYPPATGYATGAPARGYPMVGYPTGMAPKGYATGHAIGVMPPKDKPAGDMPAKDDPTGNPTVDDVPAKDEPTGATTGDAAPPASDPPAVIAPAEPAEEPDADDAEDREAARARVEQKR